LGERGLTLVATLAIIQAILLATAFLLSRRMHSSLLGNN
jgi:hypothetical protein